jgi:hypothetical protein
MSYIWKNHECALIKGHFDERISHEKNTHLVKKPLFIQCHYQIFTSSLFCTNCYSEGQITIFIPQYPVPGLSLAVPHCRAFFNYITTGAFTPVGPLLAPVVKQVFR